jgi:hypothetical protein
MNDLFVGQRDGQCKDCLTMQSNEQTFAALILLHNINGRIVNRSAVRFRLAKQKVFDLSNGELGQGAV